MSEIEQQNLTSTPINRRTVVKGAAWSVPVIAAAIAAPAASASTLSTDLAVAFGGTQLIRINLVLVSINVTLANTLTISNLGSSTSTGGEVVTLTYPSTLSQLTLASGSGLATVSVGTTSATITLPPIPVGGSEVINIGLVSLPVGVLGGDVTINATLAAVDTNAANNTASSTVGITIL